MKHLSIDDIIKYAEGRSPGSETPGETHLRSCQDCVALLEDFRGLLAALKSDALFEPPADVVQAAVAMFQEVAALPREGGLRRIIASLILDTFEQPLPAGVRHAGAAPRQLLFRAGDVDVDVRIESIESHDRVSLLGQVLSKGEKFFNNTPVRIESHGAVRYTTRTNSVGEFSFEELPKDTYHLSVELPEGQVTMFCVHRGNS